MRTAYHEPSGLNRFWLGVLLGLFLPLILFMIYFLFGFTKITLGHFIQVLVQSGTIIFVLTLAVSSNMLPFIFFMRTNRMKSGKGLIAITIFYVLCLFVMKILMH